MSTTYLEGVGRPAADGDPFLDHLLMPLPAAGAASLFKLDSTWEWLVLSVRTTLTTSVAAGNRFPFLRVQDAEGNAWYETAAQPAVAPNAAAIPVDFNREETMGGVGGAVQTAAGVPGFWIPGGWQLALGAFNMDVADQLAVPRLLVLKRNSR